MSNSQIQDIIDNAKANNVILFKGKSYSDINLVIKKSLTLMSNVDTTLKSDSSSPVISIKGSKASLTTVKGFKIEGNGDGVKVDGSNYVKIINNDITTNGNGIVSLNTKYLNVTKNNIVKNSKSGVSIADSSYSYIFNNIITNNGGNGIEVAKSSNVYIHGNTISSNGKNGIYLGATVNGVNYGAGPSKIHVNKNTISKNHDDGILIKNAGNNINVKSNSIESNVGNGISIAKVGSNTVQSNVISGNDVGIKFLNDYVKPANQDISYNAILGNLGKELEAKETFYQENGFRLDVGDNWYSDFNLVCPKIKTNHIKFKVSQIGANTFQATFLDSNGNIASLLPDRTLTYNDNGKTITMTISGGAATFTVDADNGELIRATVDMSDRDNRYDSDSKSSVPVNGKTPTYVYPPIPDYQLYEDIGTGGGNGNGDGTGDGSGGTANKGNGKSSQDSSSNGNGTHSQKADPSNNANNQVNDVSQSYNTPDTSMAGASYGNVGDAGDSGSKSQSVVKQILIDEDEFFKVTGISFIILLIILTIGLYYREDIREMKSKL
jgi:parallel beta-helix repeat protein